MNVCKINYSIKLVRHKFQKLTIIIKTKEAIFTKKPLFINLKTKKNPTLLRGFLYSKNQEIIFSLTFPF